MEVLAESDERCELRNGSDGGGGPDAACACRRKVGRSDSTMARQRSQAVSVVSSHLEMSVAQLCFELLRATEKKKGSASLQKSVAQQGQCAPTVSEDV